MLFPSISRLLACSAFVQHLFSMSSSSAGGPHDKKAHRRQKSKEKEVKEVGPGRDGWQMVAAKDKRLHTVAISCLHFFIDENLL